MCNAPREHPNIGSNHSLRTAPKSHKMEAAPIRFETGSKEVKNHQNYRNLMRCVPVWGCLKNKRLQNEKPHEIWPLQSDENSEHFRAPEERGAAKCHRKFHGIFYDDFHARFQEKFSRQHFRKACRDKMLGVVACSLCHKCRL